MRLTCPLCGERDLREFRYRGSAKLLVRPEPGKSAEIFHDYLNIRDNPAGENAELWQHVTGCRSWLKVTRNTTTHEIGAIELAQRAKRGPS